MGRSYRARPSGVWEPSPHPFMGGTHKADAGFIEVEYTGEEERQEVPCPSGRTYTFGNDEEHKIVWVHQMDLNYLKFLEIVKRPE